MYGRVYVNCAGAAVVVGVCGKTTERIAVSCVGGREGLERVVESEVDGVTGVEAGLEVATNVAVAGVVGTLAVFVFTGVTGGDGTEPVAGLDGDKVEAGKILSSCNRVERRATLLSIVSDAVSNALALRLERIGKAAAAAVLVGVTVSFLLLSSESK